MHYTLEIPADFGRDKIVNVSSVPQLSPFRYPGGKTWLVPTIRQWLRNLPRKPAVLIDPFAGGGIIPITAIAENLVSRVIMAEIDPDVAAVWRTILSTNANALCRRILEFEITRERVIEVLSEQPKTDLDHAFKTILRNRTQHGGILAPGASLVKVGEAGKGIASRWYPETLARRIRCINSLADKIEFMECDAMRLIPKYLERRSAAFFIDPPYTAGNGKRAGRRLYAYNHLDHSKLFDYMAAAAGNVMMTYDNAPEVLAMAEERGLSASYVPMKNTHHECMYELVITKSLL